MKVAFLTEMGLEGKIRSDFPNMRTEFAWMCALEADHWCVHKFSQVKDYDHVFIIFPKGKTFLNSEGSKLINGENPVSSLLQTDLVPTLKSRNKNVYYVQEGPHWWFNDYNIIDQVNFYKFLTEVDKIFAHNHYDVLFYKGLCPHIDVDVIPTLMIEDLIKDIKPQPEEKVIIGGNFARWYGGFQSYVVAQKYELPIYTQTSHAMQPNEPLISGLKHLPRLTWNDWMKELSTFKYAVHLMPTVAAGTFSLNCAYFGIPCIGNEDVDTQYNCFPRLSVRVEDVERATELAKRLKTDPEFYKVCSEEAQQRYKNLYTIEKWKKTINLK